MFRALLLLFFASKTALADVSSLLGGYNYPQPIPPIYFEEPSTPSNVYLPPVLQDEIIPSDLPPVQIPTYLPPGLYPPLATPPEIFSDEDTVVIPSPTSVPLYQAPVPQIKILNMSCVLDTSFKTLLRLDGRGSFPPTPVVDNGSEGCIAQKSAGVFSLEMEGVRKLTECGVRRCSSGIGSRASMCAVVRVPTVRGLKLPEDLVNGICDDANAGPLRNRRSIGENATTNWESQIQFRVQLPQDEPTFSEINRSMTFSSKGFILLASVFGLCIFAIMAIFLVISKRKEYASRQNDMF
ncbi:unnamed protein product [Phaedon cochleariae]|uniref:Uncharacterized protein n=1 Tax=Phaedon cochleariae TaxID=80249 RepID=A0A9N9SMF1_PHACE|nr:unnamed protein product [Phaedon cochleariae]